MTDDGLMLVDEFGRYQKLVVWFILLPAVFPCGFHAYNQLFMASAPDHWCRTSEINGKEIKKNISIPLEETLDGHIKFSQCLMFDLNDQNISFKTLENETFNKIPCKNGWVYDNSKFTETVVTEWNLVCNQRFLPTFGLVILGIGGFIGNYIFGYIQDGMGRKPAFYIFLTIQCIFGVGTAFANNFSVWAICRFGVGLTVPAILGTPYVLAIELVGPKDRVLVTILINIAYSVALITLALIVWWIKNWRAMALATTLPFLSLFALWFYFPESPRWLIAKQRYQEARCVLKLIARTNGKNIPRNFLTKLQTKNSEKIPRRHGFSDLFKLPNLKLKTFLITFIWFMNTSVYVGLSYYAPSLGGNEFLNFLLAGAVELPTYLFLWPAIEYWGRRFTLCVSMIIGGFACLATVLFQSEYSVTLLLYCIGKMGISCSFVVLPLMALELYPTVVRGIGISFSSGISMVGPIIIPLINYLGTDMLSLPLVIMGAMLVVGGVGSLMLPETLNQPLPQTLEDAEKAKINWPSCSILKNETLTSPTIITLE